MRDRQSDDILGLNETRNTWLELLSKGHQVRMKLDGYSMFPVLLPGDVAIVEPLDAAPVLGEVIVVALPQKWIAHRVIASTSRQHRSTLITQGDSVRRSDGVIEMSSVVGVIRFFERGDSRKSLTIGWRKRFAIIMVQLRPLSQFATNILLKVVRSFKKLTV